MKFRCVFIALGACLLSSCAAVDLLNLVTPTGAYEVQEDLAYGRNDRQRLDIYTPEKTVPKTPIIVFMYGGAWTEGDKDNFKFVGEAFASEGYVTVVPDYRIYPEVIYPAFVEDASNAVAFTAKTYPNRPIIIIGHSAGAHSTLMMGLKESFLKDAGVDRCSRIAGLVGISGPYGLPPFVEEPYITIFPEAMRGDAAPINNVNGPTPPIYVITGKEDEVVEAENVQEITDRVKARGGKIQPAYYEGLDHRDTAKVLSTFFDGDVPLKRNILTFIRKNSKRKSNYCR